VRCLTLNCAKISASHLKRRSLSGNAQKALLPRLPNGQLTIRIGESPVGAAIIQENTKRTSNSFSLQLVPSAGHSHTLTPKEDRFGQSPAKALDAETFKVRETITVTLRHNIEKP
jgi:hypothetical protein